MKLNEFMHNTFMRTRDIVTNLWPHQLVTGFLNWRPQIESWQGDWSSFVMLSIFFNLGFSFFYDVLNILEFSVVYFTEILSTVTSISS